MEKTENKKLKRLSVAFAILLVAAALGVEVYSIILHFHADESQRIFDDRCNNVNPTLIKYKQAYLDMMVIMKNPKGRKIEFTAKLDEYQNGINQYLPLEKQWLVKQRSFVNRWDFQLFEPAYIKELASAQLNMYQGYYDHAKVISDTFNNPPENNEEFSGALSSVSISERLSDAKDKYYSLYDRAVRVKDWRKLLWKSPQVNCPEENLTIPETGGSLEEMFGTPTPTPEDEIRSLFPNS